MERKKAYLNHLRELFEAIDVSAEGMISRESLQHAFKHEAIAARQKKDDQAKPRFKSKYGELSTGPACTTPQSASGLVSDESCNNYTEKIHWNQLDARQATANSLFQMIFSRMFGMLPFRLHTSTLWKLMLQMQQHYLTCLTMTSPVKLTLRRGASKSSNLHQFIRELDLYN